MNPTPAGRPSALHRPASDPVRPRPKGVAAIALRPDRFAAIDRAVGRRKTTASSGAVWVRFPEHRYLSVAAATAFYLAVFAARLATTGRGDLVSVFYTVPVALLAVTFGRRGGLIGGAMGVALLALWVTISGTTLDALGWAARAAPMVLLGALVGDAADRLRGAARSAQALSEAALRQREAAELHDSIVQGMAVAKWALEAGEQERGLQLLTDTMVQAEALVTALLRDRPLPAPGPAQGNGSAPPAAV